MQWTVDLTKIYATVKNAAGGLELPMSTKNNAVFSWKNGTDECTSLSEGLFVLQNVYDLSQCSQVVCQSYLLMRLSSLDKTTKINRISACRPFSQIWKHHLMWCNLYMTQFHPSSIWMDLHWDTLQARSLGFSTFGHLPSTPRVWTSGKARSERMLPGGVSFILIFANLPKCIPLQTVLNVNTKNFRWKVQLQMFNGISHCLSQPAVSNITIGFPHASHATIWGLNLR